MDPSGTLKCVWPPLSRARIDVSLEQVAEVKLSECWEDKMPVPQNCASYFLFHGHVVLLNCLKRIYGVIPELLFSYR